MSSAPAEWQERTLISLASYLNGFAFKPRHWGDEGLPIIRIRELLDDSVEPDRYHGHDADAFRIDDGDLIFSWSATLAALIWQRGQALLNQHLFKVTPAQGVDIRFLNHLLNAHIDKLASRSHGTTMRHITRDDLVRHTVWLPPLSEQHRIAETLDALDEQIAAVTKTIDKSNAVTDAVLNDLIQRLPEDGERRLGDVLVGPPRNGYSPVESSEWTGRFMLGLGCLTSRGFMPRQLKYAPAHDVRLNPFLLQDGDVLMSRSNTRDMVGLSGVFRDVGDPCFYPDLMMRLAPSDEIGGEYLATMLNTRGVRRQIMNLASGTSGSMVKINRSIVQSLRVPVPSLVEQQRIVALIGQSRDVLKLEAGRLEGLRSLKAGLVGDLLTGRVRVPMEAA